MTTLHELIDQRFGVRTREVENSADVSLDTNDTIVLRSDGRRIAFIIINTGAVQALMRFNGVPSATINIPVAPNGGALTMVFDEDFHLTGRELHGLVASGTTTLHTLEVLVEPNIGE